ncbi:MAG: adenylate/guanylate cyclase domain-containing protein [Desulfobulbus sp.]|jgi:adenylate cyclase
MDCGNSILIVEDSPVNRRLLARLLTGEGYAVTEACHGKEALKLLENERPDLILLDILMPEMDGLELCRRLKAHPELCDIPVIFISSLGETADKVKGFEAGGVDYIPKPFHDAEVLARISTHLKLCRLQRQLAEKNRQLSLEKQKSEALLLNILPARVALELMETGTCTPQCFPEVAVCFIDIAHFTSIAAALPPESLIGELNELFTAFDRIVEANHCERMKTIGDAYLFVSGIPEARPGHVRDAAVAALAILAYLEKRNQEAVRQWQVRIGLHCGQVVGGIVGTRKYLYDIFGDTVNIAARLVELAEPMRINVSCDIVQRLQDVFLFSCLQNVEMKGKGTQSTCFLLGPQEETALEPPESYGISLS